jgi:hypothetical protein
MLILSGQDVAPDVHRGDRFDSRLCSTFGNLRAAAEFKSRPSVIGKFRVLSGASVRRRAK